MTGQDKVQEETAKFWEKMFADEGIRTTEEDIREYLGEKAFEESRKVTDKEQEEMDLEITLDDIDDTIKNLKNDKAPGVTGFTNEFYKEFNRDLNIWILNYIKYTEQEETLSFMQKRGSITLIPKGEKDKRELGNWRPITLLNSLYKLISAILAKKIKRCYQD